MITNIAIQLDHKQVERVVVRELIDKYKFNVERGNKEWVQAFESVLRYYLDEDEVSRLIVAISADQLPSNPLDLFEQDN